jgi:hypothetical protein
MVGATKEVSIVSRSREIERANSMVGGWEGNSVSVPQQKIIPDEPRPSRPDLGRASHSRGFSMEEIAAPLKQVSSKAKEASTPRR